MQMFLISDNIDTYTGMRLAGVEGVVVHTHDELKDALQKAISNKEIGIILLTEKFGREFPEIIDDVKLHHKTPLIIEIPDRHGTGRKPDINYIGIEMYDSVLLRALQKREELEENGEVYSNLFFMRVDARLLPEIFEKGEVDKIYLNFSDPWPKARHAKRRLTSREFLARYDQILVQDGKVEFKTDNKELFEFSLEEVEEAGWNLEASTFDLHHNEEMVQGNVMTEYEEKFSSMGNPICKMVISREYHR